MSSLFKVAALLLTLCYPFLVYFGLQQFDGRLLLPLLLLILALRWFTAGRGLERWLQGAAALVLTLLVLLVGDAVGLKFYPVLVNLGLLALFTASLVTPPSAIERLARLKEPNLGPAGVIYTRKVTQVWCVFFVINGSIAAITALWASNEIWLLYNGMLAYLLIGGLFAAEWLIRQRMRRNAPSVSKTERT